MNNGNERGVMIQGRTLDRGDIVVVGNGIAGLTAALEARRLAPDKRIVMVTDQIHPTIHTPALKQFMIGKLSREQLLAYPAGTERAERIYVVTTRVEEVHAKSKYVTLTGGQCFGYDSLLIATGSTPTGLPVNLPGRDFDGVMTLHRLQDYLHLRRRLSEVYEAVVIGSGAHAIETVMGLVHYGIHVHWMIRGETVLSRMLDDTASAMVLARIRRAGVSIYTNTEVLGIVGRIGCVAGVITNQQQMIPCQLVLACTGTQAVSALAQHCTLPMECGQGIKVDNQLHTSVPDVYAAGDVAALRDPLTGHYETRAVWYAAVTQGRTVAASMLGQSTTNEQGFGVQWHATQLGDLSMFSIGHPLLASQYDGRIASLTDTSGGGYRRMTLIGDRLVGYLSLGQSQPDSLAIKRIIDEGYPVANITKALLRGTFDARSYLSQQQSRVVHGLLTGRLPELNAPVAPTPPMQQSHTALPVTSTHHPAFAQPLQAMQPAESNRQTDPLTSVVPAPSVYGSDVSHSTHQATFTQPSPRSTGMTEPLRVFEEEEIAPFTGRLTLQTRSSTPQSGVGRVINSTLVPVVPVQAHRTLSGKLWSYMPQESPALPRQPYEQGSSQREQRRDRQQEQSRGLWSYNDYEDRKGR